MIDASGRGRALAFASAIAPDGAPTARAARALAGAALLALSPLLAGVHFAVRPVGAPPGPPADAAPFTVEPGAALPTIAEELEAAGLVPDGRAFTALVRVVGGATSLRAGRYALAPGMSMLDLSRVLREGQTARERVTLPEGWRTDQIAGLLARKADVDSAEFHALAVSPAFARSLGVDADRLEGYLHPETYNIYWRMPAADAVRAMVGEFHRAFGPDERARAADVGLTVHEVVTLASIVEAEARLPEERPRIAAVYWNRLRRGMRLEADPTVRYALGFFEGRLLYEHLEVDSPYNTYRRRGLPPGPIGNPGRAALLAALYPEEGTDDLFFVARGDGGHLFARTNADHEANKRALRRAGLR